MNTCVIQLAGEITMLRAGPLKQQIAGLLSQQHVDTLVLDMREVSYVDSSGLGALVWAFRRVGERGGTLRLQSVQPRVKRLLDVSEMGRWLKVLDVRPAGGPPAPPAESGL